MHLIRYGNVTDTETTAFDRRAYYLQFPRERGTPCHAGPHGIVPRAVRREKE